MNLYRAIEFSRPLPCPINKEDMCINDKEYFYRTKSLKRRLFFVLGLTLFFILFPTYYCNAQHFKDIRKSSYNTYIYKISPAEAKKAFISPRNNLADYCKVVVDSFPSDSVYKKNCHSVIMLL